MAPLNLSFIWHMHQPDYRDSDGVMKMPWVFLHAIKDYYEMPWLVSRVEGMKATFNITPPLIEQLNLYAEPLKNDYFLSLWAQHPSELDEASRSWLVKICTSSQFETMVRPFKRYAQLYHQSTLDDAELIDLELLFMLSWCGNYLRKKNKTVKKLIKQGKGYRQTDKAELLDSLKAFVATILPFYAELQEKGVISVSTTPYNHPILPLLLDMKNAKRANPHTPLPDQPLSLEADALEQVRRAVALYRKTFGRKPKGFWPAEGAVDVASLGIYRNNGIRWIATDEAILFRSLDDTDRAHLYRPYRFDGVTIGFRDHALSDFIGFTCRYKAPKEAVEHFMHSLEGIAGGTKKPTVFVILDGENAWEFFENNAYDFFMTLYGRLQESGWCRSVTMDEVAQGKGIADLERLAPGSWIHGTFDTWAGHKEKNRAWELIYQTRRDVDHFRGEILPETAERIRFHFLAAECSDWFWWYGDDHVTDFGLEFDALFREHLISIYHLLQMQPPSDLFEPIISHKSTASFLLRPQAPIYPVLDGSHTTFFEWLGSGMVDESRLFSTMDRARGPIEKIHFGHNRHEVLLAFEGDVASLGTMQLSVTVEETSRQFLLSMDRSYREKEVAVAVGERVELSLSRSLFDGCDVVHLRFELLEGETIVQTMPGYGALSIDLEETYAENWFV
jgi:alpha-amylase/alpha-mannosidase (GH57 family)